MVSEFAAAPGERRGFCVAGLGNPGRRYAATPHNMGFFVVEELGRRHKINVNRDEGGVLSGSGRIGDSEVVLMKPQLYMNQSGPGLKPALKARRLTHRNLIVVYDELDLPWTALRIKRDGSAAGHNGVKSIIAALDTDSFTRVRVGIRPDHPIDPAEYVLAPLEQEFKEHVDEVVSYAANAVESIVAEGAVMAMTKFNRRALGIKEEDE